MIKNKVAQKERDAWSDLANFIEKWWQSMRRTELDQLPNPDCYLRMKRVKQLYKELYKQKNIEKFIEVLSFLLKEMLVCADRITA